MSGVFQNIDPPPPHCPASVYPPAFEAGGRTHSLGGEGVGVSIAETALYYVSTLWVGVKGQCLRNIVTIVLF